MLAGPAASAQYRAGAAQGGAGGPAPGGASGPAQGGASGPAQVRGTLPCPVDRPGRHRRREPRRGDRHPSGRASAVGAVVRRSWKDSEMTVTGVQAGRGNLNGVVIAIGAVC